MKPIIALVLGLALLVDPAVAQVFTWRDGAGRAVPDTEARKSRNGFAAWILTTSDTDWEAKWNTSPESIPQFTVAHTVRKGERVTTLLFVVNPLRNSDGNVNVRCDLHVTRPSGSVSIDRRDVACLEGPLQGDPFNLRMAMPTLPFVGEVGDPLGIWTVRVTVRDLIRNSTIVLRSSFKYVGDG